MPSKNKKFRHAQIFMVASSLLCAHQSAFAGEVFEKIKSRGVITVCTNVNNSPLAFLEPSGEAKGMQIDLLEDFRGRLSTATGKTLKTELVPTVAANRIQFLQQGKCDMIFTSLTVTPERQKLVDIVEPFYYAAGPALLTKKTVSLASWDDLKGKPVCSPQGASFNRPLEQKYGATVLSFPTQQEVDQSLRDGRCIGVVADDTFLQGRVLADKATWGDYVVQDFKPFDEGPWGVAIQFGDAELHGFIATTVTDWHRSGAIIAAAAKWGLKPPPFAVEAKAKYAKSQ